MPDGIPHAALRALLRRKFKEARLLALFGRIIGAFRGEVGRGLPIGSLTSQAVGDQLGMVSVQAPSVSRRKPLPSRLTM